MGLTLSMAYPHYPALPRVRPVRDLDVNIKNTPTEVTVYISGEAGIGGVDDLAAGMLSVCAWRPKLVTLDLGGLRFISSLGMGALVTFRRAIVRAGGRVRLAYPLQESVRDSLVRADLLALFDSPEEELFAGPRYTC